MDFPRSWIVLIAAVAAIVGPASKSAGETPPDPGYSSYAIGNISSPRQASTEPALLLAGGGNYALDAFRWFAGKSGHGHLVILAASGGAERGEEMYREVGGFASVQTLIFRSRKAAFDGKVLKALRRADAIFIAGGDQANYVRYWKGTPVARAIDARIRNRRPVGGTSAGLAILGGAGYGAMDGGSIESATALADPLGPPVTIVRDFLHMPFMAHIVTDTHFMARNRLGRLIAFVANVRATSDAKAVGLGIDEGSALAVDAKGIGRLYSVTKGSAWLVQPAGVAKVVKGRALEHSSIRITRIGIDGAIDLKTLSVTKPVSSAVVSVRGGQLNGI
ncbi:MAG TPA: cyanophycinase [Sphingomicrobium sp.]|nr:cyanophycinase [Sphingomicrobium sp.]